MSDFTVMIPCLNEAKTLPFVLGRITQALESCEGTAEILVVDNGSTDDSVRIAEEAGARVVREDAKGYGNAVRRGLQEASGDFIVYADADASYDFAYVPAFFARLQEGNDLVIGSRFHGRLHPKAMPWLHRYVGTPFLTWIINTLYGTDFLDCNCGMRGVRRSALKALALKAGGMEMASEMLIRAKKTKLKVAQLPMDFFPDQRDGPSHLRTFRDGFRHIRLILWQRMTP